MPILWSGQFAGPLPGADCGEFVGPLLSKGSVHGLVRGWEVCRPIVWHGLWKFVGPFLSKGWEVCRPIVWHGLWGICGPIVPEVSWEFVWVNWEQKLRPHVCEGWVRGGWTQSQLVESDEGGMVG